TFPDPGDHLLTSYRQIQTLFLQLQTNFPQAPIDTLSMGTSDDLDLAIQAGSTMLRIGRTLFGAREPKLS
ncbi:MAG: YggS family pyridoxal phosphate enzyme, partial [Gammaproteobacteria bacterium]|nr:YggS family pyridoxal phosphate enzyme [Gammaproteobacteria bacterium]